MSRRLAEAIPAKNKQYATQVRPPKDVKVSLNEIDLQRKLTLRKVVVQGLVPATIRVIQFAMVTKGTLAGVDANLFARSSAPTFLCGRANIETRRASLLALM